MIRAHGVTTAGPPSRHPRSASASTAAWAGSRWNAIAARHGRAAARRHPPATRHANLEAGSFAEVQILSIGSLSASGPDNQADPDARDHALQVGASGRGALGTDWPSTD